MNASSPLTWDRYLYAGGDPVNQNDPSGRDYTYCVGGGGESGGDEGDDTGGCYYGDDDQPDPPVEDPTPSGGCTEDGCPDSPLAPVVPPPAPPPCTDTVQLFTWSWGGSTIGLFQGASHSYIQITGPGQTLDAGTGSNVVTTEGNSVVFAGQLMLVGQAGSGAGIPSDTTYAADTVKDGLPQIIPCALANTLEADANNFNPVPYNPLAGVTIFNYTLGGYNSNSFMHWFLNLAGWVQYYANTPAENGIGWNAFPIRGN